MSDADLLARLEGLEKANGQMNEITAHLRSAVTVTAATQERHATIIRDQEEHLELLDRSMGEMRESIHQVIEGVRHLAGGVDAMRSAMVLLTEQAQQTAETVQQQEAARVKSETNMRRIETNLAESTEKLNALIGYVDHLWRSPPAPAG